MNRWLSRAFWVEIWAGLLLAAVSTGAATLRIEDEAWWHDLSESIDINVAPDAQLSSVSFELVYNTTEFSVREVELSGLFSGWALAFDASTPGRVTLSASGAPVAPGDHPFCWIKGRNTAAPGAQVTLSVEKIRFNGSAAVDFVSGTIVVEPEVKVSGNVWWLFDDTPVAAAKIVTAHNYSTATTDQNGDFTFILYDLVSFRPVALIPPDESVVSEHDAAILLRHLHHGLSLDRSWMRVADLNNDGVVNEGDASHILRFSLELETINSPTVSYPDSRSVSFDQMPAVDLQDFKIALRGDVTGNSRSPVEPQGQANYFVEVVKLPNTHEDYVRLWVDAGPETVYSARFSFSGNFSNASVKTLSFPEGVIAEVREGLDYYRCAAAFPAGFKGRFLLAELSLSDTRFPALNAEVLRIDEGRLTPVRGVIPADLDSDGDGLTDLFERDVLGTNPYQQDTDGDGWSDAVELAFGSDPLDSGSFAYIRFSGYDAKQKQLYLTIRTYPGRQYQVQYSETLLGPWNDLGTPIEGNLAIQERGWSPVLTQDASAIFWRLKIVD